MRVFIEADAPRVRCAEHGVVVAAVPWARHGSRFTRMFADQAAWLATRTDRTTVSTLLRVSWRTVGRLIERVSSDARRGRDQLDGLRRIGIDEISYRKRHKYVVVVVDHDTGRLVWAKEGRERATVDAFLDELGAERCAQLELVSADAATWIANPVRARCPNATLCLDPFHIVQWATAALDEVRREVWRDVRRSGDKKAGLALQRARFVLWKNPEKLTDNQQRKLSEIQSTNKPLYRAYLLKEQLRMVFQTKGRDGLALLDHWLAWAARSRLKAFVALGRRIRGQRDGIAASLEHGLSNARTEALNTRIRLVSRLAFGFHSAKAMIGLAMLKLGGLCPPLPGR